MEIVFLDTETNGFSNCSVLSICAIKCEAIRENSTLNISKKDHFSRYYFPVERFNTNAIDVNGLSCDVIEDRRTGKNWPRYFKDDSKSFLNFISGCDHLVCHNVDFDKKFLPISFSNEFCTMRSFSGYYKSKFQLNKNPKLSELVNLFQIDTKSMSGCYHEAEYDVECLIQIFKSGYNIDHLKTSIDCFLNMPAKNILHNGNMMHDKKISKSNSDIATTKGKAHHGQNSIVDKISRLIGNYFRHDNPIVVNDPNDKEKTSCVLENDDEFHNILQSFDNDLSFNKLTPFPSDKLTILTKHFSNKSSLVVRNVDNCCCDDGCKDKEIQPRMQPKVERLNNKYKIFGNRAEDVFPLISKIYKNYGKNNTRTYIVGNFLYSLQHKYVIPNGKIPVKIGRTRITLDLNQETYIIYPERQLNNFYYLVEVI